MRLRGIAGYVAAWFLHSGDAAAQPAGCEVTMPQAFRLLETQNPRAGGPQYPPQTRVRAITYGTATQGGTRAVRVRIDTAEGWVFLWPSQLRACSPGSVAQRAGDVGATPPAQPPRSPEPPPRACVPGATQACLCVGGAQGVQSCNPEGSGYAQCACAPQAPPGGGEIVRERPLCAGSGERCNPDGRQCCGRDLRCSLMSHPDPSTVRDWVWECRQCGRAGQRCCREPGASRCLPGGCVAGLVYDEQSEVCNAP